MKKRTRLLLLASFIAAAVLGYFTAGDIPPALAAQCCDECDDEWNYCQNDPPPQLLDWCQNDVPRMRETCKRTCHNCGIPDCEWRCTQDMVCWCVR